MRVASELMDRIADGIPVLPVSLVAEVLQSGSMSEADLITAVQKRAEELGELNLYFPASGIEAGLEEALQGLEIRRVITREDGVITVNEADVLGYYANTIAHFAKDSAKSTET